MFGPDATELFAPIPGFNDKSFRHIVGLLIPEGGAVEVKRAIDNANMVCGWLMQHGCCKARMFCRVYPAKKKIEVYPGDDLERNIKGTCVKSRLRSCLAATLRYYDPVTGCIAAPDATSATAQPAAAEAPTSAATGQQQQQQRQPLLPEQWLQLLPEQWQQELQQQLQQRQQQLGCDDLYFPTPLLEGFTDKLCCGEDGDHWTLSCLTARPSSVWVTLWHKCTRVMVIQYDHLERTVKFEPGDDCFDVPLGEFLADIEDVTYDLELAVLATFRHYDPTRKAIVAPPPPAAAAAAAPPAAEAVAAAADESVGHNGYEGVNYSFVAANQGAAGGSNLQAGAAAVGSNESRKRKLEQQ